MNQVLISKVLPVFTAKGVVHPAMMLFLNCNRSLVALVSDAAASINKPNG